MPARGSVRPKEDATAASGASFRERLADAARGMAGRHPAKIAAALAAAVFLGTLANEPVLDDGWAVINNPLIRTLDVARIFAKHYGSSGGATVAGTYRPVATLTCAIQYALHGPAPIAFHAVNVLLHAATTALVVLLARRVLATIAPARAAAGALGVAALLLALSPRPRWRLAAASAALAAAVLSKEIAATVPLLYLLVALLLPAAAGLDATPGLASRERRRALLAAASVAAALALAVVPYFVLKPGGAGVPPQARWFQGQPPAVVWNTVTRAAVWRTPERLYETELLHAPLDPVVNNNLAMEYSARGDHRGALERLDVVLRTAPWYWPRT